MQKQYRLAKNEDFKRVIEKRQSFSNRSFVIFYDSNELEHSRIGISVSSKYGIAVLRNKAKRQVRMMIKEIFDLTHQIDIVIIIREGFKQKKYEENKTELNYIYEKLIKKR